MNYNEDNLGKNLLKNGFLFASKLFGKDNFRADLVKLIAKWPSPYRKNPLGLAWENNIGLAEIKTKNAKAYEQRVAFINNLNDKDSYFYADINLFIEKYDFGSEWVSTITDYVISDWVYPPLQNLNIKEKGRRVVLELNPDTSLDDIKDIWPAIKEKQSELWPNYKKTNFSKKMFKNLFIALQDIIERNPKKGVGELDMVENKDYKITDLDIVGKIWANEEDITEEADRRNEANLRQIRKRLPGKNP